MSAGRFRTERVRHTMEVDNRLVEVRSKPESDMVRADISVEWKRYGRRCRRKLSKK